MQPTEREMIGLAAVLGVGWWLIYSYLSNSPVVQSAQQAAQATGEAIGGSLFDFLNPTAGLTPYESITPNGIVASSSTATQPGFTVGDMAWTENEGGAVTGRASSTVNFGITDPSSWQ